jgi:predicted homoserine dehydrogenase-like protein
MLDWFPSELGPGPFYVFERPFHLVHIEAMATVAEAALDGRALLAPWKGLRTDVYAYAKRGLKAGARLDGIGGYSCYGLIENCGDQGADPGIPMTLADEVVLKKDVPEGGKILRRDVEADESRIDFRTYALAVEASRRLEAESR